MSEVLTEFIGLLTGGIVKLGEGIGAGLNGAVSSMFLETTEAGVALSTFGSLVAIFGGIALAISFVTLVFNWLESIGN